MKIDTHTFRQVAKVLALVNPIYEGSEANVLEHMIKNAEEWHDEVQLQGRKNNTCATGGYVLQIYVTDGGYAYASICTCVADDIVKAIKKAA